MKNQYVNKVSYAKKLLKGSNKKWTRTVDVYDKDTGKKVGTKDVTSTLKSNTMKSFNRVLQNAYDDYKSKVKQYNKGEIGLEQVEIADYKLFNVLENIKGSYNKKNKEGVNATYYDEEVVEYLERVGGRGGKKREEILQGTEYENFDVYNAVANILNKAEGKNIYSADDIYNKLYSNALETQRYEELLETLAEDKANFNNILSDLKSRGKLSDDDEQLITELLVL